MDENREDSVMKKTTTIISITVGVLVLLAIAFYAGMQYKAYQVRTYLNNFAEETLSPMLDEMIEEKTVQYPDLEDMDILPPEYSDEDHLID